MAVAKQNNNTANNKKNTNNKYNQKKNINANSKNKNKIKKTISNTKNNNDNDSDKSKLRKMSNTLIQNVLSRKNVFNSLAHECANKHIFEARNTKREGTYGNEKEYQNSFGNDIMEFSKKFTDKQKRDIDYVIYHRNNADGYTAAFVFWKYLTNSGKDKNYGHVIFEPLDPGFKKGGNVNPRIIPLLERIKGKNVLGLDISMNRATLKAIDDATNSMIWIDDHQTTKEAADMPNIFVGDGHSATAFTQKFFYPDKDIPVFVQYVDANDAKLFLPFLAHPDLFSLSFAVRITNNVILSKKQKNQVYGGIFDEMNKIFPDDKQPSFMIFIGNYMNEIRENMKFEISNLAQPSGFQGYRVGVLNFDAPGLAKVVGRQIVSNFKNRSQAIDFSVIWAYQYIRREYRIQLATDHSPASIDVSKIAEQLGALPDGGKEGGGGHPNLASFYWKGDIFDLFTKQLI